MAKTATKKSVKKAAGKTATKKPAKAAKKTFTKAAATRNSYPELLKNKVAAAIRKGITQIEASAIFKIGANKIPNWIRR